jgi:predicted signal transduction protein with EAL and GGDEF domain
VRASIGRAVFPADADSADALLRRADASMFEAKRSALGSR